MLRAAFVRPSPRLHPVLAALPLAVWTAFHLWEQWVAFSGRDAWLDRMRTTSQGPIAIGIEIVAVLVPLAAWAVLAVLDLVRGAGDRSARDPASGDVGTLGQALARLSPLAALTAIVFVAIHAGHLWGPKVIRGASLAETWWSLTHDLGHPAMLVLYALGLSAIALHLAVAIPEALVAMGWVSTAPARRQATLVASVFAICAWILAVQLTGWVATGHGSFWSIDVIDAAAPLPTGP